MASSREESLLFMNPSTSSPVAVSDTDSYLLDSSQIGSASGSFQNEGFLGGLDGGGGSSSVVNIDADFGFSRSDFKQSPLVASVEFYQRHVFLCYKNPRVWPPRIDAAEFDRLPRLLSAALCARKSDMKRLVGGFVTFPFIFFASFFPVLFLFVCLSDRLKLDLDVGF